MKTLWISHVALGLLVIGVAEFYGAGFGLSAACGAGTSLLNIAVLGFTWGRIMAKKQVALAIGIIVFKFALFAWIIYLAVRSETIHMGWFAAGLGVVIPSALITALWKR